MHWSLTPGFNLLLVCAWAAVLAALMALGAPLPGLALPIAGLGGMLVGAFQRRAMGASRDAFRSARTALVPLVAMPVSLLVRPALRTSASGRAALALQYAAWLLSFAAVAWRDPSLPALLVAAALFFLARDATALPGVLRLNRPGT